MLLPSSLLDYTTNEDVRKTMVRHVRHPRFPAPQERLKWTRMTYRRGRYLEKSTAVGGWTVHHGHSGVLSFGIWGS